MLKIRESRLTRSIVIGITFLQLNMLAAPARADAVQQSSGFGQSIGQEAMQGFSQDQALLTLKDIFPEMGPDSAAPDLQAVYGRDEETVEVGTDAQSRLLNEATMDGEAYRTIRQSGRRVSPDLRNDPMFNSADTIRDADFMAQFREEFADCDKTQVFENREVTQRVQKLRTCERVLDSTGNYSLVHDYTGGIIEYVGGQQNIQSCGPGCLYVWVGTVGDNYWSGQCTVFEELTEFKVVQPKAIISATIDRAIFDDYFQVHFNNELVWTHTPGVFPPETGGPCERATDWRVTPNHDVTALLKSDADSIVFKTRTSVTGRGEGYARIKITYDPTKAFVDNGWGDDKAVAAVGQINDGFCSSHSAQCTNAPELDANGCFNENGVQVCESQLAPSPYPGIAPSCKEASLTAQCGFYKGDMECYTDAQGTVQCPSNDGGNLDTCTSFEQNPSCGFISQKCIEGAEGSGGGCYAFEEVWDCGYDVPVSTVVNTGTRIECPGGARCMGSECFDTSNTLSNDFAYAVAMLQVAQFAEHDLDCGDYENTETANTCTVFKGEAMECKKALGGYVDCCEAPEGVSVFDYVRLTMSSLKMASSVEALNRTGSFFSPGYWQAAQGAVSAGAKELVTGNWGGVMDAATGQFNQLGTELATDGIIAQFKEQMMKMTYDAMKDLGADAAADAMFQQGATEGGMQLSSQAMTAVNFIGAVYTAYVIADLMIKVIWECEEKEFELGAKKETRQCAYVGSYCASEAMGACVEKRESYCCFGSVVGRIIQEQGRPQLGLDFGDPETPSCEGLSPADMQRMDWSEIDLGEWIGMLSMTNHLPTVDTVDLEQLTGSGSALADIFADGTEPRANSLDRNVYRLTDVDVDEVKRQAEMEALLDIQQQEAP